MNARDALVRFTPWWADRVAESPVPGSNPETDARFVVRLRGFADYVASADDEDLRVLLVLVDPDDLTRYGGLFEAARIVLADWAFGDGDLSAVVARLVHAEASTAMYTEFGITDTGDLSFPDPCSDGGAS